MLPMALALIKSFVGRAIAVFGKVATQEQDRDVPLFGEMEMAPTDPPSRIKMVFFLNPAFAASRASPVCRLVIEFLL